MNDASYKSQGLFQKYAYQRVDGQPLDATEQAFVLRFDKPDAWGAACRAALRDFAARIETLGYGPLADDLRARIEAATPPNEAELEPTLEQRRRQLEREQRRTWAALFAGPQAPTLLAANPRAVAKAIKP